MDYMICGDEAERVDFFGLNVYSWCGHSSFKMSKYEERTNDIKSYGIPFIVSEYGCNTVQPRTFDEVRNYRPAMNFVFAERRI
jgi:hypothetical protein